MVNIVILTTAFPYLPGEQFFEDEVKFWPNSPFSKIYILPSLASGQTRSIPETIIVDTSLSKQDRFMGMIYIFSAMISPIFIRELKYLIISKKISIYTVVRALWDIKKLLSNKAKLGKFIKLNGSIDIAYSYWNDIQSYAACLLKREGKIVKVVSRAHGFDLYEERRTKEYMPLKRQFTNDFDAIFTLSDEGKNYYIKTYSTKPEVVQVSALGVPVDHQVADRSTLNEIHIVSVSACIEIKRIDKIIDAIVLVAQSHPEKNIQWTHIGDGPLISELKAKAEQLLELDNVAYLFKGNMQNVEVKQFFFKSPVDMFVNISESEGMPVSIMEAMSAGVPVIAPNVGGISFLVDHECGVLMSNNPSPLELAQGIGVIMSSTKINQIKMNAKRRIQNKFSAEKNYSSFMTRVYQLMINLK